MTTDKIVKEIEASTKEVLTTMLGLDVQSGKAMVEKEVPGPTDGVVALVGFAGDWTGTGSISCCAETACKLSGQFLMSEYESVDEEVLDAIAELTNMIVGNFKTIIEEELGPMGLSVPTVIYGRNFHTRTLNTGDWTRVPFHCSHGDFDVHVCLSLNKADSRHPTRPGHNSMQPVGIK